MLILTTGDAGTLEGRVNADLTGATAEAHLLRPDGTLLTKTCTFGDRVLGEWSFEYETSDLTTTGFYRVEIEVTFSNNDPQTFAYDTITGERLGFRVREEMA